MEEWRPIKRSKGQYEVSSLGRVRNTRTGRILKTQRVSSGTCVVQLKGHIGRTVTIARLVAEAFVREDIGRVSHRTKDLADNRVENLIINEREECI